jgi:hypothetical protein
MLCLYLRCEVDGASLRYSGWGGVSTVMEVAQKVLKIWWGLGKAVHVKIK